MAELKTVKEPLFHIVKKSNITTKKAWIIRTIAIFSAFIFVAVLSWIALGISPINFVKNVFIGAFGNNNTLNLFREVSILLLIALAVTPAFKMKFWNIGAEGQTLVSALTAYGCIFYLGDKLPSVLVIFIMLILSVSAGIIWAVIPAIFKAKWNTNETLFTLMMNYVATQLVILMTAVWATNGSGSLSALRSVILPKIGGDEYWFAIIVAVLVTALMFIYLKYTKQGYEISVVGESEKTAKYVGIGVKKVVIRTLVLSGAICGITGVILVAGKNHVVNTDIVCGYGFTAILVSWLAKFNPIFMIFTSFMVLFLTHGTSQVMSSVQVANNFFAEVVVGIVFLAIIACEFFIVYSIKKNKRVKNTSTKEDKK